VRVVSLREEGAKRGTTLFHVGDLMRYLDKLAEEQARSRGGAQQAADAQRAKVSSRTSALLSENAQ
jgi:hypothetical protein